MNARQIRVVAIAALTLVGSLSACGSDPTRVVKVREPLGLSAGVAPRAQQYAAQGSSAYLAGQYGEAKALFAQAVAAAPNSGEAHYDLGLALFKLGETDAAREHFIQAANLAPGNKVIWDSPALSPYSNPDPNIPKKALPDPYRTNRGGVGGSGGYGGVGGAPR